MTAASGADYFWKQLKGNHEIVISNRLFFETTWRLPWNC